MEITVIRTQKNEKSTIGEMRIEGLNKKWVTLEDLDRGLTSDMPLAEIKAKKVFAETAIPTGRYKIERIFWERFKKFYPHIMGVPGFDGVLIHSGTNHNDTEGCILVGSEQTGPDAINGGFQVMDELRALIFPTLEKEEVWITITNA